MDRPAYGRARGATARKAATVTGEQWSIVGLALFAVFVVLRLHSEARREAGRMKREGASAWPLVIVLALLFSFVGMGMWWMESRFGSAAAIIAAGVVLGVGAFAGGAILNQRNTRATLEAAADFTDSLSRTETARQGVARSYALMERDAAKAQLMERAYSMKQVEQLATQRARAMLGDSKQQQWQPRMPAWSDFEEVE